MSHFERELSAMPGGETDAALRLESGQLVGTVGGDEVEVAVRRIDGRTVALETSEGWVRAVVVRKADVTYVAIGGEVFELQDAETAGAAAATGEDATFAASPMTGVVAKLSVAAGAEVPAGQELFVVEAMKMEYVVRAPRDVVVAEVRASAGESVELGQVLVTFAEDA